jgi:hypothetical protein
VGGECVNRDGASGKVIGDVVDILSQLPLTSPQRVFQHRAPHRFRLFSRVDTAEEGRSVELRESALNEVDDTATASPRRSGTVKRAYLDGDTVV